MVTKKELRGLIKEKVLLVGNAGTGKTYAAVKVASALSESELKVVFIDPEWGSNKELERLTDSQLENIDLKITPRWELYKDAVLSNDSCYLKVVDGISEGVNLYRKFLEERFVTQGFYNIGEKTFEIKDPSTFVLPWNFYARIYDSVRDMIYEMLEHDYHILVTMHYIGDSDAKKSLEQDIYRKVDSVLQMERTSSEGKPAWFSMVRKNRGRDDFGIVNVKDVSTPVIERLKELAK